MSYARGRELVILCLSMLRVPHGGPRLPVLAVTAIVASAWHSVTNGSLSGWQGDGTHQTLVQKHIWQRAR